MESDSAIAGSKAPRESLWPLWLVFVVAFAMSMGAAAWWTPTYDEPNHLEMGQQILSSWDFSRFDNSKMPVSLFNALGWNFGQLLGASTQWSWWWARLPQVGWLLGTAWVVFIWVRQHHGYKNALCAAALVAFDPNLQAHSALVTTDAPCTFFIVLCTYLWAKTLSAPSKRSAAITGIAIGLAQAVKFTSIFLVPILAITTLLWAIKKGRKIPLKLIPIVAVFALLSLNSAYSWQGSFTRSDTIEWRSETFSGLSNVSIPLPVPRPWIEGLDWVKSDDDMGHGNIYLNEETTNKGRKDYFLRTMAIKFPIPLIILGLVGLFARKREGEDEIGLTVPPIFLLCWFSLAFNFQLGLRYVLPVIPFFAMFAARLHWAIVGGGAVLVLASNATFWPWGISYVNETIPRIEKWRYLADSNVDWGQGERQADWWRRYNEDEVVNPIVPTTGPMLVSANVLTGVLGDPVRFACLREQFPPTSSIASYLYPYNLSVQDFSACFSEVSVAGHAGGTHPSGDHLVIMLFRGQGELSIGELTLSGDNSGEVLLGAVVHADAPFDVNVQHEGWDLRLFVDGIEQ